MIVLTLIEREREREILSPFISLIKPNFSFIIKSLTQVILLYKKKKKEPSLFIYIIYFFLGRGLSGLTHLFEPSKRLAVGKKNR